MNDYEGLNEIIRTVQQDCKSAVQKLRLCNQRPGEAAELAEELDRFADEFLVPIGE